MPAVVRCLLICDVMARQAMAPAFLEAGALPTPEVSGKSKVVPVHVMMGLHVLLCFRFVDRHVRGQLEAGVVQLVALLAALSPEGRVCRPAGCVCVSVCVGGEVECLWAWIGRVLTCLDVSFRLRVPESLLTYTDVPIYTSLHV